MKLPKHLPHFILLVLALFVTILISNVIPEKQFALFSLELDSVWQKNASDQVYVVDLNNDSLPEFLTHHNINQSGHSIEYRYKDKLHTVYIFYKDDFCISKFLHFSDVNQDGNKEIVFITVTDEVAWLNVLAYNKNLDQFQQVKKIEIGSARYYNHKPDVINNFITSDQSTIYFDLTPGYSVKNRYIYKYDLTNDSLTSSDKSSIVVKKAGLINIKGENYLLAKEILATGNTMTSLEYESMERSTNKDTIEIFKTYKPLKYLVYDYGDFSSYILLFNNKLNFAFKPIEFYGWTNFTKSDIISINDVPHIIALTNTDIGDHSNKVITLCDLHGKIIKQFPLPRNFTEIYTDKNCIVFRDKEDMIVYSNNLEVTKQIQNITHSSGFFDIDGDRKSEFIAFRDHEMMVFSPDFNLKARIAISQEFAPYPQEYGINTIRVGERICFYYNTNLYYYLFSLKQNPFAIFKYPFYILVFLIWAGLLLLILRLNSRRLENEKQHLEEIVSERTLELQTKNQKLTEQKEEIHVQAKEIALQYHKLERLDQFKRILISTLVHDLKNPLSQIIAKTSDKQIKHISAKMLGLVSNLLDVEKHEHTTISLNKEVIPLDQLIDDVVAEQQISLQEKNIKVNYTSDNPNVVADPALLSRMMENLLTNAIRYTPLNAAITISALTQPNGIVNIAVSNPGSQIKPEMLHAIFDKYVQDTISTHSSSYRSTGLGLTFCRMVAAAHGHTIKAANTLHGVTFSFTLDGNNKAREVTQTSLEWGKIDLTNDERLLLQPWLTQLQSFEPYMICDIRRITESMPSHTPSLVLFKQQLLDAAYASNYVQFRKMVKGE